MVAVAAVRSDNAVGPLRLTTANSVCVATSVVTVSSRVGARQNSSVVQQIMATVATNQNHHAGDESPVATVVSGQLTVPSWKTNTQNASIRDAVNFVPRTGPVSTGTHRGRATTPVEPTSCTVSTATDTSALWDPSTIIRELAFPAAVPTGQRRGGYGGPRQAVHQPRITQLLHPRLWHLTQHECATALRQKPHDGGVAAGAKFLRFSG